VLFKKLISFLHQIAGLLFVLFPIMICAQNIIIKGNAPGAEGKTITLLTYNNQITYIEEKITSAPIDSSGNFIISFNIQDTISAILKIDYYKSGIFIEPNNTYILKIDSIDYHALNEKTNPYYEPKQLNYSILNINNKDLNFIIPIFDGIYNDYIRENYSAIYRFRDFSKIDTFRVMINRAFSYVKSDFFKNYVNYSIALLEIPFISSSRSIISEKYLKNRPVQYENLRYMNFFNDFFDNYLLSSYAIKKEDLIQTINYTPDYYALTDTLGKDSLLRNEVLRELVLLKGLYQLSNDKEFNKNNISTILLQLSKHTKFETHRKIAENIMQLFNKLQPSTIAPPFSLKDINKQIVSLSDFKGKYVYLNFWTSWCTTCQSEFGMMNKLKEIYGSKIAFVSISADKEFLTMVNYLKTQKYNWQFLHFDDNYDLLEAYGINSYPIFVLIDTQGKIISYPALKPSESIANYFEYLIKKDNPTIKKPLFPKP